MSERYFFWKHFGLIHPAELGLLKRFQEKHNLFSLIVLLVSSFLFHLLSSSSCLFFSLSSCLSSSSCLFSFLASLVLSCLVSVSLFLRVMLFVVLCGVCRCGRGLVGGRGVFGVCVLRHAEKNWKKTYLASKNASVCTFTTSPCVPAPRAHVVTHVRGVCYVCAPASHEEKPVCRFKTIPCVPAKRAHVLNTCARCAGTHGSVLNRHGHVLNLHTERREEGSLSLSSLISFSPLLLPSLFRRSSFSPSLMLFLCSLVLFLCSPLSSLLFLQSQQQ